MSPSTRLSVLFVLLGVVFMVVAHYTEELFYSYLAIPSIIIGAVMYILAPQINWQVYKKKPPMMPGKFHHLLEHRIAFYQQLHPYNRKQFRERTMLFIKAVDWKAQVIDEFPADMQLAIAASATRYLWDTDQYHFPNFEHVILYPHPFPSPQYKEWHVGEIEIEDGVVILAAEATLRGFLNPEKYYPIALHEYAKVFMQENPDITFPATIPDDWNKIPAIGGYNYDIISRTIGLKKIDLLPVLWVHYLTFGRRMQQIWPDMYEKLDRIWQSRKKEVVG